MSTDIEQVEMSIERANESVELMDAYGRLMKNKDFMLLIKDTYFLNHASRLVLLRGDPNISPEHQAGILKDIDGIGSFRTFLREIVQAGNQAKGAIEEYEGTLEELREESA
jgi:hypothetical protein